MNKGVMLLVTLSLLIGLLTGAYSQNENKITVQSGPVKVKKGESVSLWCKLKTDGKYVMMPVHWQSPPTFKTRTANCDSFKEEKYVISCSKTGKTFRFFNLTIMDVQFVDEGSYRCIHGGHIDLVYLSPFVPVTDVSLTYAIHDIPTEPLLLNAVITCTTNCAYPEPKISWFENDQPFKGKATVTVTDVGCTGTKDGQKRTRSTVIVHVDNERRKHSINCTAENVIGEKTISRTIDDIFNRSNTADNDVTPNPPQPGMDVRTTATFVSVPVVVVIVSGVLFISIYTFVRRRHAKKLQNAVAQNKLMLQRLLKEYGDVDYFKQEDEESNRSNDEERWEQLIIASRRGSVKTVHAILENQTTDVDKDKDGETALMFASENGRSNVVFDLIMIGSADVNKVNKNGSTALMLASEKGHRLVVDILLQHKAEVNKENKIGSTALLLASKRGHREIVDALLRRDDAKVNKENKEGSTALMLATRNDHLPVVEALIKGGAEVNKVNKEGSTALMLATRNDHLPVVEALIKGGAEVNKVNKDGSTALMLASQNDHLPVVEALIKGGAEVDKVNKNSRTALMIASKNGHLDVVDCLLKHGADVNKKNKDGLTALTVASQKGHFDVVDALSKGREEASA
ncbi:ankyrin repeat and death domain-containing protein 1B-like isoform X2 [Lineus longissimus]|uniref:ankyrin repeat and death domain-containing protein 1B-like isoform X2 n=1 Tax=Lineus longissimus TaxID=88925 RepID=UPI00315C6ED1